MGRGIKKISENVIADKRSLMLVTRSEYPNFHFNNDLYSTNRPDTYPAGLYNTPAMPLGMLNVDYGEKGLSIKIAQDGPDYSATWSRLDAKYTLITQSIIADLLAKDSVTTEKIVNQNITTEKIKNLNVTTEKLGHEAVTEEKIYPSAVTTVKIKDQNVTTAKIADQNITTDKIADKNITEIKFADGAVSTRALGDSSVTTVKIMDQNITTEKIRDAAVTTDKIADDAVTSEKIMDGTIRANNISIGGVSNANLQDACVSTDKLEDLCVTNEKLANNAMIAHEKIMPGTITKELLDGTLFDIMDRVVLHDGTGNVTGENRSTVITNLTATEDIYARRVYNVVYMDIAEGYIPGEELEAGDIVAIHEDGKVYKAKAINDCIVGVVSNEFANCLGASEKELIEGSKVAVGMIGKIHVKVKGPVRLGQRISISPEAGIGIANWMNNNNIGQALETVQCNYDEVHTILVQVRPM